MKKASKNENVVELDLFAPEDFGEEENGLGEEENAFAEEGNAFAKEENAKVAKADEASEGEVSSVMVSDVASLFLRLSQSRFRSSFYLNQKDRAIIADKGMATIREHAAKSSPSVWLPPSFPMMAGRPRCAVTLPPSSSPSTLPPAAAVAAWRSGTISRRAGR